MRPLLVMDQQHYLPNYSDYIVFVDESGDHGLVSIDPQYPVFSLVFVIVEKNHYVEHIIPGFQKLKMKYWGHGQAIFHESDIRKESGFFGLLRTNPKLREAFYNDINHLIKNCEFKYVASVIDKIALKKRYAEPWNPYEISMLFCVESLVEFLMKQKQFKRETAIIIESRGKEEDKDLELEFRRICDNQRQWGYKKVDCASQPLNLIFTSKSSNSCGLQIADLIARPIALSRLRPEQANRAYEIIKSKCMRMKWFP